MTAHRRILVTLAAVFVLMLLEALRSAFNERRLRARGAIEPGDDVFPVMRILYPMAFLVPALEGWMTVPPRAGWWVPGLAVFAGAKALKYWVIATLGHYWSFRVLVLPGAPLVTTGPYRFYRHPNYVAVAGEIAGAAMLCGAPWSGTVMTLGFAAVMWRRIRVEERALAAASSGPLGP
jgi:methyltransferase